MTKPRSPTATMMSATTTIHAAFDLPGASGVGLVCERRASSSASAAAVERTPDTPEPKPLTPEIEPEPEPGPVEPVAVRIDGSDGIDGSELECTPLCPDFDPVDDPGLVLPVRERILRSP